MRSENLLRTLAFAVTCALALEGCGGPKGPPQLGPPEVGVVTIEPQPLSLSTVLPGRTSPFAVSDVRPQVNGLIQARSFQEGSNVREGQVLYQIDPSTYKAAYDQAVAQLASAQANVATAKAKADRYADLVKINGVAKQDYDDANAAYLQAAAAVQQDRALVQSAKINLDFTSIRSPISGRVGVSAFTKGALVTSGQANALTTVQTLDPIYVDISQSSSEVLKLRQSLANGSLTNGGPTSAEVSLQLEDGSPYPIKGRLELVDVTVDQTTGAVTLRAIFPNPNSILLPGMFVRATVSQGGQPAAILIPQAGLTRDPTGRAFAMVVDAQNRAQERMVTTGAIVGDKWMVLDGVKAGDRVIVEGLQKVKPGAPVRPVPAGSPPPPPPGASSAH